MPSELLMDPDADWDSSHVLRASAERAFVDWQLQEKLSRAKNSRHHSWKDVYPGDLVFYWRSQVAASDQHSWKGKFVGPARVLAVETKREGQMLCPSSVVWLVRGSRLVKVAIEQIRPASARELALHELERPSTLPWTFAELMAGARTFDDHTGSAIPASHQRPWSLWSIPRLIGG